MFEICLYEKKHKSEWDDLVSAAKNGSFLFYRDYMDYHGERFDDCSFIVRNKGRVIAALPGNIDGSVFHSHEGLTFGGFVLAKHISLRDVIHAFELINNYLVRLGVNEVVYKPAPHIYQIIPAQEDIYYLFSKGAEKIGCNIASVIYQNERMEFSELRRRCVKKSSKYNILVTESEDFAGFWDILNANLYTKYKVLPVHSIDEITYLRSKFEKNIRLFTATLDGELLAGAVVYENGKVAHVQYIASTGKGRELSALDLLFDKLINEYYVSVPVFDFGHSTEDKGRYLNENLVFQKEGFGGRGVVYEIYRYMIALALFLVENISVY